VKVSIVNAYTRRNAGDAALLGALVAQVRSACLEADVSYSSLEDPAIHVSFEGATNVGSIRRWSGDEGVSAIKRIARKSVAMAALVLPAALLRKLAVSPLSTWEPMSEVRALSEANLVIGMGGGYLNGAPTVAGTLNVLFLVLPLVIGHRLDKRIVLAPQSYGPFGYRHQERLVRWILNRVAYVDVREDESRSILIAIGVHPDLIHRGVDSAFSLQPEPLDSEPNGPTLRTLIAVDGPLLGITVRQFLSAPDQARYECEMAKFIDWAHFRHRFTVVLMPQVVSRYGGDDDRIVSRRIADMCTSSPAVLDAFVPYRQLRAMYGELDYIVGTRFHSIIFSVTALTPAIAIEYEHKTPGIMADLGLDEWVLSMSSLVAVDLADLFTSLMSRRIEYLARLQTTLPSYRRAADQFVDILRDCSSLLMADGCLRS
jgi:colanic acid/amylovoran biosynthesis protein